MIERNILNSTCICKTDVTQSGKVILLIAIYDPHIMSEIRCGRAGWIHLDTASGPISQLVECFVTGCPNGHISRCLSVCLEVDLDLHRLGLIDSEKSSERTKSDLHCSILPYLSHLFLEILPKSRKRQKIILHFLLKNPRYFLCQVKQTKLVSTQRFFGIEKIHLNKFYECKRGKWTWRNPICTRGG